MFSLPFYTVVFSALLLLTYTHVLIYFKQIPLQRVIVTMNIMLFYITLLYISLVYTGIVYNQLRDSHYMNTWKAPILYCPVAILSFNTALSLSPLPYPGDGVINSIFLVVVFVDTFTLVWSMYCLVSYCLLYFITNGDHWGALYITAACKLACITMVIKFFLYYARDRVLAPAR